MVEGQDLPCTYLAHYDPAGIIIIIIIIFIIIIIIIICFIIFIITIMSDNNLCTWLFFTKPT